jgi:Xaa-Pro aminopeptidase
MNDTATRRAELEAAEAKGNALFDAIEMAGLLVPGKSESALDKEIFELAAARFGVKQHWHKRVVRVGINTLCVFHEMPPERTIEPDDIVYLDLGPVFEAWEADIGRSYVVGGDAAKQALVDELPRQFEKLQTHFRANPDITGAALYAQARANAEAAGWAFGGAIAGHIVGEFPHAVVPGERNHQIIWPNNDRPLSELDSNGRTRFWIGEIHLTDKARTFGGFYERLL